MVPFVGQVCIFGFNFAPRGWAFCRGQLMPIAQNVALFQIIGTYYGGNGTTTFALPNLQASAAVGVGQGPGLSMYHPGQTGGASAVTLQASEMPSHNHAFAVATGAGTAPTPQGNLLARAVRAPVQGTDLEAQAPGPRQIAANFYSPNPGHASSALAESAIGVTGNGQPHNNMQPSLALNFCIALQGVMPQR